MSTGLGLFADFRGKARGFLRKRPLELLFFFAALSAAAAVISAYKANASDISLEIEGPAAILQAAKVYGVSGKGMVIELERGTAAWTHTGGKYVRKLLLALPKDGLADVTGVRAAVGKRDFEFKPADFRGFRVLRLGAVDNREWDVYELPWTVRDHKSLAPNFSTLNWRGDAYFCLSAALRFLLCCLALLLPLSFLNSAYLSEKGAPGDGKGAVPAAGCASVLSFLFSGNRTIWTFLPAGRSREVVPGRAFHLGLVFFLTAGVIGALALLQVDPHHDGIMLKPAFDVAAGQTLFRDTFTQYGALTTWVQALAVRIFGRYLLVIRLLTALAYGLTAVLMWLVYSRFLPYYLSTFSCLAWLFLGYFFLNYPEMFIMPWSTVFAVCSALLGLHLTLRFLETGSRRTLFAAGSVTALTFWFKINYGGIFFLTSLLSLALLQLREERRRAAGAFAAFLGGCLSVHALFAGWLAAHGSLRDFKLQSIKFALAFSGNNTFSANEPAAVQVVKSLFQVDSPHGGLSYLWLVLPLAALAVFCRSGWKLALKKDASLRNKTLLAASAAALGLWLGYYPVPALMQMYLSSALFFGLLSYLVLAAAARLGFAANRLLILAVLSMIFLPDFGYKLHSFMLKMAKASSWERIESPEFLRGLYVPGEEKKAYAELAASIGRTPGRLINLTNSGLYSLFRDENPNFHRMYLDWGWNNSFLYPDYIPAIARQLSRGDSCVIANDAYMLPGYIPAKVFPAFARGAYASRPVVLLLPGRPAMGLKIEGADTVRRLGALDGLPQGYRFRFRGAVPRVIENVTAKIVSKDTIKPLIPRYEYEYGLLPRVFDPAAKALIVKSYSFDAKKNGYAVDGSLGEKGWLELMGAFSVVFLYENSASLSDTFLNSDHPATSLYRNGKQVRYGEMSDGTGYRAGDGIDIVVPAASIPDSYVARLRIIYKGGRYQEEVIKVLKK